MAKFSILFTGIILIAWSVLAYLNVYYIDFSFQSSFVRLSFIILLSFFCILIVRYFLLIYFSYLDFLFPASVKKLDSFPLVSILVPAHNEAKGIEEAIKSLLKIDYPHKEIIIIDDGSTDNTLEIANKYEGFYPDAEIRIITQENRGKAETLNNGIKCSHGEFIFCMDADSILEKNVLLKMLPHMQDKIVGAVAGNVKVVNTHKMLTMLQSLEYIEGLNMVKRSQSFLKAVNIVPGPAGLFRRTALKSVGGYDSDTFAEDCDLTIKLLYKGWRVNYEPEAVAWTEAPETIVSLLTQRYRWTRGILQSLRKHKEALFVFHGLGMNTFTLWYMSFEALLWPIANIFAQIFFVYVAFTSGLIQVIMYWWIQLTLLDMVAALHCILLENEKLIYVPYSILYRFFFILIIDVCKVLATLEEIIGVKMVWGTLERKGRLSKIQEV